MPYRILCNGTFQKSQKARSGLGLASSRRTSLHNNRYCVVSFVWLPRSGVNIFSDSLGQLDFWTHAVWPLYFVAELTSNSNNNFWQTEPFLFYGYPILNFLFWYLLSCIVFYLVGRLK